MTRVLPLVRGVHQLQVESVRVPFLLDGTRRNLGVECHGSVCLLSGQEEKIERHGGEAERDQEPENDAGDVDEALVLRRPEAEGLEHRLEAMLEVVGQEDKGDEVEGVVPRVLERVDDPLIHRLLSSAEKKRDFTKNVLMWITRKINTTVPVMNVIRGIPVCCCRRHA